MMLENNWLRFEDRPSLSQVERKLMHATEVVGFLNDQFANAEEAIRRVKELKIPINTQCFVEVMASLSKPIAQAEENAYSADLEFRTHPDYERLAR